MADEFDDAVDGRLVIATDDERMDCTESAILGRSEDGKDSAIKQNSGAIKTELENVAGDFTSNDQNDTDQNCWRASGPLAQSNIAMDCFKTKCNANEATESAADGGELRLDEVRAAMPEAELVKWEQLDGGTVAPAADTKPSADSDRKSRSSDSETKVQHLVSEQNQSLQFHHGVHNFLRGGTDSKKKKLMLDKGTCVLSRPTGVHGLDEHLLAMRPGTNLTIDITIICKAGSNTLYISAKWKGREYHGVLTDGEPLFSHTYAQKRNAAQNAEKLVFETGTGNNGGGTTNQKAQNAEKATGGGISGKRGGKRGVGGHQKGGGAEKRTKNHSMECQNGGDVEDESVRNSKIEDKVRMDVEERVPDGAEMSGGRHQTDDKLLAPHPHGHSHSQHQQQQIRRRRTSSSASSGVGGKSVLYDGDAATRIRCPHQQCGHRFETMNELNAHLLVGTAHGVARAKAKIFESTASQTAAVQVASIGCDPPPCFSFVKTMSNNAKSGLFCPRCQKGLAPDDSEGPTEEVKRPQVLDCDGSGAKSSNKQKGVTDNSPGFSDISDDAAPTLEKEESFDKQTEEAKKASSSAPAASVPSTEVPPINRAPTATVDDPSAPSHANKSVAGTPSKSAAVSIIRQNLLTHAAKTKTAPDELATCAPKTTKKSLCSSVASTIVKTPTTTTSTAPVTTQSSGEPNASNAFPMAAQNSEITAPNALPSGFPYNHFLSFGPHLSQAFASALAQDTMPVGVLPTPAVTPLGQCSSSLSAGLKMMSPPSAAGLLSLGTPLAASANQMPNCGASPSKSAEPPTASHPVQHKLYELQQQQGGALLGRSSSTKPSTSSAAQVQSVHIGTSGAMGGGSNASSSSADIALMRPNSAISAVGHHSQQQLQNSQMHASASQQLAQSNRQFTPGAPSPIGGIGMLGGGGAGVGSAMHHLGPSFHHPFFPSFSSIIAGTQFGIPPGNVAAAPNILAAAAQQQQQQSMTAFRRNNSGGQNNSGGTHQQQAVSATQQHATNALLMPPFVPQGLSPGMLTAGAAASNFDLNALQHYAAALIAAAPPSDGMGNAPVGHHHQQQQQPNQK